MSITDDSTGLDLTWAEKEVVAFTAGTLSTIADCVAYVEAKLRRGTLSATTTPTSTEVQEDLIRAKGELCEVMGFTWQRRYATASAVAGTYRYALPPDYGGGKVRLRETTNNITLKFVEEFRYDLLFPDPSTETNNTPEVFTIKNMELWLMPPPNSAVTLELDYERTGDDNTQTDFSYLPQSLRFRCCDFAIFQAFRSLHMWQESALYQQDWMQGLLRAKKGDSKKKWANMEYQAMSILQVYANRGRQLNR